MKTKYGDLIAEGDDWMLEFELDREEIEILICDYSNKLPEEQIIQTLEKVISDFLKKEDSETPIREEVSEREFKKYYDCGWFSEYEEKHDTTLSKKGFSDKLSIFRIYIKLEQNYLYWKEKKRIEDSIEISYLFPDEFFNGHSFFSEYSISFQYKSSSLLG